MLVGLDDGDDAAAVRISGGQAVLSTTDFFTPVVDDPYDWGRIAAANALSDVYAMGGTPVVAINLVGWPREVLPMELMTEVLRGGLSGPVEVPMNGAIYLADLTGGRLHAASPDEAGAIVVDENYVLRIPDGIALDEAAPLLCAGITLYSPLRHWGAGPGKKVAIVGLGGLGHVGVKIAHALGAEVTVVSQSLKKMEDGLRLGADHYHATSDPQTFRELRSTFDLILNTVSANLPIGKYLGMLALDGTLVELGLPEHPIEVPAGALIGKRRSFAGSMIGGIAQTQEMLNFCAEHGIGARIEKIGVHDVDVAYDRVVAGDVRSRFVIDTAGFEDAPLEA